ncbi:MAG: NACHT domain-containing protein [Rivularia sp. (in: Bacteria)]|nr:NACHT domain-containing protein [Rivularia sp. MS3]
MEKLVIFQPSDGDFFKQGFERVDIFVYLNHRDDRVDFKQLTGKLPTAPYIANSCQSWRKKYQDLLNNLPSFNFQRGFVDAQITHISIKDFSNDTAVLRDYLNDWLDSEIFISTKNDLKQALKLNYQDEIRFIIQTSKVLSPETKNILHRLPWHWWNIFPNHHKIEFSISLNETIPRFVNQENTSNTGNSRPRRVKVLGIFGNTNSNESIEDINILTDQKIIKDLRTKGASPRFLHQPQRSEFTELWHEAIDIFCFSGHSNSREDSLTGWLYINPNEEALEIKELKNALRAACEKGLQLVIFNSCDGLGLAQAISDLNIPQIIVWRESVPDKVAQRFLFYFLESFAADNSLYQSVREAREKLQLEGLEKKLPGVTTLPTIVDNSGGRTIAWKQIRRTTSKIIKAGNKLPISPQELKNRRILLNKVNNLWVKPILENQLQSQLKIELGLEEHPDALNLPSRITFETPQQHRRNLPVGTRAIDVFDDLNNAEETISARTLLILGEPGSGKTTTLLEIARDLIADAWEDENLSIPVMLNLSSWGSFLGTKNFSNWLVNKLYEEYQIPKSQAKTWIEKQRLLLLFDGLDEVKKERRSSCLAAINQFIRKYSEADVIVCSRIQDYNTLLERFWFQAAIYIQPLKKEQIYDYFQQGGDELTAVKQLLQEDKKLLSLATNPLMLNIITIAYRGMPLEELRAINSVEESRQNLFKNYINRMFERRNIDHKYSKKKSLHYLICLAQRMEANSQSKYLIEQMQPDWLQTKIQKLAYNFGVRLIFGIIAGLIMALYFATQISTYFTSFTTFIIPSIISASISALLSGLQPGLLPGIVCGLIYILSTALMIWQDIPLEETGNHIALLSTLFIDGTIFGLALGIEFKNINIKTVDTIRWSYSRALLFTKYGILSGLAYVGLRLIFSDRYFRPNGFYSILYELMIFSVLSGIIGGLDKGQEIEKTTLPNQGIIRSFNYSILLLMIFLPIGIVGSIPYSENFHESISIGLAVGFLAALVGGQFSGLVLIKHSALRFILWVNGYIPFNCARFLDYAAERILLQKSGGGYIFYHRSLLEYFALLQKTDI